MLGRTLERAESLLGFPYDFIPLLFIHHYFCFFHLFSDGTLLLEYFSDFLAGVRLRRGCSPSSFCFTFVFFRQFLSGGVRRTHANLIFEAEVQKTGEYVGVNLVFSFFDHPVKEPDNFQ